MEEVNAIDSMVHEGEGVFRYVKGVVGGTHGHVGGRSEECGQGESAPTQRKDVVEEKVRKKSEERKHGGN